MTISSKLLAISTQNTNSARAKASLLKSMDCIRTFTDTDLLRTKKVDDVVRALSLLIEERQTDPNIHTAFCTLLASKQLEQKYKDKIDSLWMLHTKRHIVNHLEDPNFFTSLRLLGEQEPTSQLLQPIVEDILKTPFPKNTCNELFGVLQAFSRKIDFSVDLRVDIQKQLIRLLKFMGNIGDPLWNAHKIYVEQAMHMYPEGHSHIILEGVLYLMSQDSLTMSQRDASLQRAWDIIQKYPVKESLWAPLYEMLRYNIPRRLGSMYNQKKFNEALETRLKIQHAIADYWLSEARNAGTTSRVAFLYEALPYVVQFIDSKKSTHPKEELSELSFIVDQFLKQADCSDLKIITNLLEKTVGHDALLSLQNKITEYILQLSTNRFVEDTGYVALVQALGVILLRISNIDFESKAADRLFDMCTCQNEKKLFETLCGQLEKSMDNIQVSRLKKVDQYLQMLRKAKDVLQDSSLLSTMCKTASELLPLQGVSDQQKLEAVNTLQAILAQYPDLRSGFEITNNVLSYYSQEDIPVPAPWHQTTLGRLADYRKNGVWSDCK